MAFSYRTPAQEFLSFLPSESQQQINSFAIKSLEKQEKSSAHNYSYHLTDSQKKFCSEIGIPLSVHTFQVHPHPYCKTIENFILHDNLFNYRKFIDIYVSMKEEKVNLLRRNSGNNFHRIINRCVADRDLVRYNTTVKRDFFEREENSRDLQDKGWFFHDELHHWEIKEFAKFLSDFSPKRVFFSAVIPVEVFKSEESCNPSFYKYEVHSRKNNRVRFTFFPDGSRESAYCQSTSDWCFKYKYIEIGSQTYTISFLRSIKCHHLLLVEKGKLETNDFYISDESECAAIGVFGTAVAGSLCLPVRKEVLKRELIYLLSLKKSDMNSAAAKLRQLSQEDYSPNELCFFLNLAGRIEGVKGVFKDRCLIETIIASIASVFPKRIARSISGLVDEDAFLSMLSSMDGVQLKCERRTYPNESFFEFELKEGISSEAVLNSMEKKMYGTDSNERSLEGTYSMIPPPNSNFILKEINEIKWRRLKEREERGIDAPSTSAEIFKVQTLSFEEARFFHNPKNTVHKVSSRPIGRSWRPEYSNCVFQCNRFRKEVDLPLLMNVPFWSTFKINENKPDVVMKEAEIEEDGPSESKGESEDANEMDESSDDEPESSGVNKEEEQVGESESPIHPSDDEREEEEECSFYEGKFRFNEAFLTSLNFMFNSKHAYSHNGRKALLFSTVEGLDYGFGTHKYKSIKNEVWEKLLKTSSFNSVLVQRYEEGARIGLHRDDEKVYDDDEILTWNISGEADFIIERPNGVLESTHLFPNSTISMPKGSQRGTNKIRHGVENCTKGRISATFRIQKRFLNGDPIEICNLKRSRVEIPKDIDTILQNMKNACFLDCLSDHLSLTRSQVFGLLFDQDNSILTKVQEDRGFEVSEVIDILTGLDIPGRVVSNGQVIEYLERGSFKKIDLIIRKDHIGINVDDRLIKSSSSEINLSELIGGDVVEALYSIERARKLIKSFQEGATGVVLNRFKIAFNELYIAGNVETILISGFAGSGKSRDLQNLCSCLLNKETVFVSSPRKNLLRDWELKIGDKLKGKEQFVKLRTFEAAISSLVNFRRKRGEKPVTFIVDEVTLMPGGYLDLVRALLPKDSKIIALFDPLQAHYYSKGDSDRGLGLSLTPFFGCSYRYRAYSYRFPKLFDLEGFEFGKGVIDPLHMNIFAQPQAVREKIKKPIFLCPSEEKARELSNFGEAYTFGTSQGLTFDFVIISLDMDGALTSDFHWMVAMTRARRGFAFLTCPSISYGHFVESNRVKLIGKVLKREVISKKFWWNLGGRALEEARPVKKKDMERKVGKTREEFEEALEGDPWLKGILNYLEMDTNLDPKPEEPLRKESPPRTHLCIAPVEGLFAEESHLIRAREFREFRNSNLWSEQFDDSRKNRKVLHNRAETFEQIYPSHKNSDDLTFWAAIKKRMKFSDPYSERRKLERLMDVGENLCRIFVSEYGIKRGARVDVEETEREFLLKRVDKAKSLITAHSERSDPDWMVNHFFLFMKTQLCTKFEKRFCDAKAGQTLACFSHQVLARFGVPIRVAEKQIRSQLGENIYIHSGKQLEELNDWCKRYAGNEGTDSDYESFDRSQDVLILAFEIHLLKFLGWNVDLIEDYVALKLRLGCRLGYLAVMRFTGEFGTFFLNTCCNMLFTCLRYKIDKKTALAFAGDDMYSPGRLEVRRDREFLLNRFQLKAKVNFSKEPMFCGWRMTKYGIVKEPKLVLERFKIAEERGTFKECLINYCLEVSFAYRLGERLYEVIKNIEDQQALVRIVVKNKKYLPKKVRKEFESFDHEFGGCESVQEEGECNRVHSFGCGLECSL